MKFTEFKNLIGGENVPSVILLEGEDAFFRSRGIALVKAKFPDETGFNYASFDGTSAISEIESSLSSLPFCSEKRITLVKEFYPDSKMLKGVINDFLSSPPSDGIFIISNEKACAALKKFSSVLTVDCEKSDLSTLVKWIKAECLNYGASIDGETASMLAEYCLRDMSRIENETHKLACMVGEGGTITLRDVDENVFRDSEFKIYEMTEQVGKRNFDKALSMISEMIDNGDLPRLILGSLYRYIRKLLFSAISGGGDEEIAKALGVQPYAVVKLKRQAKFFSPRSLKKAADMLADYDFSVKSGIKNEFEALWISVFKIMTE